MKKCIVSYTHNCFDDKIAATMFHSCGYDYQYISDITDNYRNLYLRRIQEYIDNNIPVLCRGGKDKLEFCLIYGYEGDQLSYLICDNEQPRQLPYDFFELIFVGEKKYETNLAKSYHYAVMNIPNLIQMPEKDGIYCGKEAFLNWSNSYQDGTYDNVRLEDINVWNVQGYI